MAIDWLLERMSQWRSDPALVWSDQVATYGDILELVGSWRSHLDQHGVKTGQVVALRADYTPRACALLLALMDRKAIVVPLTESVEVHREEFLEIAEVEVVISFDDADAWELHRRDVTAAHPLIMQLRSKGESGLVLFSSGSTGKSKAALHSFAPLLGKFKVLRHKLCTLTFLLLDHIGGQNTLFYTFSNGGTIVLDEIGDVPLKLQPKLLRVIQDGEFERLGNPRTISVDVRVIAATNRDLTREVEEGRFRRDLFYRLNVFPISVPALRDRSADIPLLVKALAKKICARLGKKCGSIPRQSINALMKYNWPGNVRELENLIERAAIVSEGPDLLIELPVSIQRGSPGDRTLEEVEREHILRVLAKTGWRIKGEKGAAEILALKPSTLRDRMKKLGIRRPLK